MVMNAIINRKSVRKYSDRPITEDILDKILDAGRLAPSWVNVQPWKFIAIRNDKTKELLSLASGGQQQVKNAQVVICCIADLDSWGKTKFGKILAQKGLDDKTAETVLTSNVLNPSNLGDYLTLLRSVEQVTYAVSYMTLAAEELGIGCCVVGALSNELTQKNDGYSEKVKEVLNLNNKQVLVDLLTLGYEENIKPANKLRKPKEEVIYKENL